MHTRHFGRVRLPGPWSGQRSQNRLHKVTRRRNVQWSQRPQHNRFRGRNSQFFVRFAQRGGHPVRIVCLQTTAGKGHLSGMHSIVGGSFNQHRVQLVVLREQQNQNGGVFVCVLRLRYGGHSRGALRGRQRLLRI